jgi:hypothetical protein
LTTLVVVVVVVQICVGLDEKRPAVGAVVVALVFLALVEDVVGHARPARCAVQLGVAGFFIGIHA